MLYGYDKKETIENSFGVIKGVEGIEGALVIIGNKLGSWDEIPKLVKGKIKPEPITKG